MLYIIIILIVITAIFGLSILKNWLTSANTSRNVIYAHGVFAAIALVLLIIYLIDNPVNNVRISLTLLIVAAIGGFYMFFRDLKGKFSPTWLAVIHGAVAATGLVFLLLMIF